MKNTILAISLLSMGLLVSCTEKKETTVTETTATDTVAAPAADTTAVVAPEAAPADITITGEVTGIENGKDGYTATLKTKEGKVYSATISIPNMEKGFKRVKEGETVTVTGEPIEMQNDILIKVKSFQ
jgi:hypothetical protein